MTIHSTIHSAVSLRDTSRDPYPDPCIDCGRAHLNGEHVVWSAPLAEPNQTRIVWQGCVDCFIRRTDPAGAP